MLLDSIFKSLCGIYNITNIAFAFELVNLKAFIMKEYTILKIKWENHIRFGNKSQIDSKETTLLICSIGCVELLLSQGNLKYIRCIADNKGWWTKVLIRLIFCFLSQEEC